MSRVHYHFTKKAERSVFFLNFGKIIVSNCVEFPRSKMHSCVKTKNLLNQRSSELNVSNEASSSRCCFFFFGGGKIVTEGLGMSWMITWVNLVRWVVLYETCVNVMKSIILVRNCSSEWLLTKSIKRLGSRVNVVKVLPHQNCIHRISQEVLFYSNDVSEFGTFRFQTYPTEYVSSIIMIWYYTMTLRNYLSDGSRFMKILEFFVAGNVPNPRFWPCLCCRCTGSSWVAYIDTRGPILSWQGQVHGMWM